MAFGDSARRMKGDAAAPLPGSAAAPVGRPGLMPCLMLRRGRVCRPGPDGPVPAVTSDGSAFDVFNVLDALTPQYPRVYLVDLDGVEHNDPQLEYLQEISRDVPIWVDAGVRSADGAIDILVAGAEMAVLSNSYIQGPRELKRAWRLSTEIVFEIEIVERSPAPGNPAWGAPDVVSLAAAARAVGPQTVVLSPRGEDPDWSTVLAVAAHGPTWIDGSFEANDTGRLAESGASGGIFHIDSILDNLASQ